MLSGGRDPISIASAAVVALPAELRAWMLIDVANSVYSTVGISGFLPLLIQSSAATAAGWPLSCANVITNATAIASLWRASPRPSSIFLIANASSTGCDGTPLCVSGVCAGLPTLLSDCRDAAGLREVGLRASFGSSSVDPTAFATLCVSFSVAVQAAAFASLAGAADYGAKRKQWLLLSSWVGAAGCLACVLINPSAWWLGMPLAALTNCAFGVTTILYNSFLPLISSALPEVLALPPNSPQRAELQEARSADLSSKGFALGYSAGVIGIMLCVPLAFTLEEGDAYRGAMLICGVWWALFMLPVKKDLLPRPGPPLPGTSILSVSFASMVDTLKQLRTLSVAWRYLLAWAFFSDGVFCIGYIGGLYANSRVAWGCGLPKSIGVLLLFILVPLAAAVGNIAYLRLSVHLHLSLRTCVVLSLLAIGGVIPLWGAISLTSGTEVLALGCWYGFHLGAMQAFSRSLFATLIPRGSEARLFSLYELTNRGSSWLGPLVLSLVQEATGSLTLGFLYVAIVTLGGAAAVWRLDFAEGAAQACRAAAAPARGEEGAAAVAAEGSSDGPLFAQGGAALARRSEDSDAVAIRGGIAAAADEW